MQILDLQTYKSYKLIYGLIAAGALATLAVFLLRPNAVDAAVGGPTCRVPADYSTIQAAVDDSGCDTVKVSAGTYNENVTINRTVKLRGAKAGVDVDGRTFAAGSESTIKGSSTAAVTINAANVVLDGFSVTNPNQTLGVVVKTAGNNAKIRNNIVDTVGSSSFGEPTVGVYLELGPDGVRVTGNRINNVQAGAKSAQGVLIGDSTSNDPSLDTVIDNNTIKNITSASKGGYGIQANNGVNGSGYTEVKIRANTISNISGGWVHAIGLEGETPNAIVRYNEISNLNASGADRIGVYFEDNQFFFTVQVNRNSLGVGSDRFGVAVAPALVTAYPSLSVDAECNWWGAKSGPGQVASGAGSLVAPGVDYEPWLKNSNLNSRCSDRQNRDEDNDWHHGDKDCRYDDIRGEHYRD